MEQAAAVYAADLGIDPTLQPALPHPGNVWSLHGYHECLQRLGRTVEAAVIATTRAGEGPRRRADPRVLRLPTGSGPAVSPDAWACHLYAGYRANDEALAKPYVRMLGVGR